MTPSATLIDVFDPGQARADGDLRRQHDAGPVSRIPDDEDDDPIVILTHPDGARGLPASAARVSPHRAQVAAPHPQVAVRR